MNNIKVRNITSNKGNPIANQFEITKYDKHGNPQIVYFQSYKSTIVEHRLYNGLIMLDKKYWNYSNTTGRYRNIFLDETRKETEAKIKSGKYKLVDLNEHRLVDLS